MTRIAAIVAVMEETSPRTEATPWITEPVAVPVAVAATQATAVAAAAIAAAAIAMAAVEQAVQPVV
jgi:hypothetical protein